MNPTLPEGHHGHAVHITIVTSRGGRRINDSLGQRHNLCGAAPSLYDLTWRDARRSPEWVTCPRCRTELSR